eukprot:UN29131
MGRVIRTLTNFIGSVLWLLFNYLLVTGLCCYFVYAGKPNINNIDSKSDNICQSENLSNFLVVSLSLRGHLLPLQRIGSQLLECGHNLTFATHYGSNIINEKVDLNHWVQKGKYHPIVRQISEDDSFLRGIVTLITELYLPESESMFDDLEEAVKKVKPDLLLVDVGTLAGFDIADLYSLPYIVNSPSLLFRLDSQYLPAWGSGFDLNMTIWERCISRLFPRLFSISLTPSYLQLNSIRKERGLKPFFQKHNDIHIPLITIATGFGLEYAHPVQPNVLYLGPVTKSDSEFESDEGGTNAKIQEWLELTKFHDWVLVISFGSSWLSTLTQAQTKSILDNLKKKNVDQGGDLRFLLDMPSDMIPKKQRYGYTTLNPRDWETKALDLGPIMSHPSVRVLLSDCGVDPVHSALLAGKPILCLPIIADQLDIAARIQHRKVGLYVTKDSMENLN